VLSGRLELPLHLQRPFHQLVDKLSKETANEESEMRSKGKNKERGRRKYNKE
jgi:hypothetical protein